MPTSKRIPGAAGCLCLLLSSLLGACGDGGNTPVAASPPAPSNPVIFPAPAPVPSPAPGTGTLRVTVQDPEGRRLAGASVFVRSNLNTSWGTKATANSDGVAVITGLPGSVFVSAQHPFGGFMQDVVAVNSQGTTDIVAVISLSKIEPGYALLSAVIPAEGVNASRTELQMRVRIAWFLPTGFVDLPSFLRTGHFWQEGPLYILNAADSLVALPESNGGSSGVPLDISRLSTAVPGNSHRTLLLLDRSARAASQDPHGLLGFAGRHFVRGARPDDQIAVAGFAGSTPGSAQSPRLPMLPVWYPAGPGPVFPAARAVQEEAVGQLEPLSGGGAAVLDALDSAFDVLGLQTPGTLSRAAVMVLSGGDESGRSPAEQDAAIAALKRKQSDYGIRVLFVAPPAIGSPDEAAAASRKLRFESARLAAHFGAPLIDSSQSNFLGAGLETATRLLSGEYLVYEDVLTLRTSQAGSLASGTMLHGYLFFGDGWDWGFSFTFAASVP